MQYTELKGRKLWYDGDMSCTPSNVMKWLGKVPTDRLHVTEVNSEIKQYNALVDKSEKIGVKNDEKPFSFVWQIPDLYKNLDVKEYVVNQLLCFDYTDEQLEGRIKRVLHELALFKKYGYIDVLRCLIYVVEVLEENDQVWGVGRGSSVSSYVLYLIGVHEIDSYGYKLPFDDFLRHQD